MVRTTDLVGHRHALRELIHCSQCHSPLTLIGEQFVCPQSEAATTGSCETPATDADTLLRAVMKQFIVRLLNEENSNTLIADAQREVAREARETAQDQNRSGLQTGGMPLPPSMGMFMELPPVPTESDSRKSESELEALWMQDTQEMRVTALDPTTYLDYAEPGETRELLRAFVEEILVGPHSVEMAYHTPMPDSENRPVVTSDHFQL